MLMRWNWHRQQSVYDQQMGKGNCVAPRTTCGVQLQLDNIYIIHGTYMDSDPDLYGRTLHRSYILTFVTLM